MLTPSKKLKFIKALKNYKKKFLDNKLTELDESGTRLMINSFLSDVLGYLPIEEIKTEYMIKGTYADYVIQVKAQRHFLVEVKALSFQLSEKHLRQTINYGANEGIEWALLTNGKNFDFYKILFTKPIEARKIFSIDLNDDNSIRSYADQLQYLHREAVLKKSLRMLWNKCEAVHPLNIGAILYSKEVINTIKRLIKNKYGEKCEDDALFQSINRLLIESYDPDTIKPFRSAKSDRKIKKQKTNAKAEEDATSQIEIAPEESIESPSAIE